MKRLLLCLALVTLLACGAIAQTTPVPSLMNFQGRLAKPDGTPVADGNHTLAFTLFDAATGGTSKWTETQTVTSHNGVFAVLLGSTTPLNETVFTADRWLELKVDGTTLTPRQKVVSNAFAFKANTANLALTVPDGSITGSKIATGTITADKLQGGIPVTGMAGGDLTGLYPNPSIVTNPLLLLKVSGESIVPVPASAASTPLGSSPDSVAVAGRYCCITESTGFPVVASLQVYDVSDPANPVYKGGITADRGVVAVSGNYAYVASGNTRSLSIFDVSGPTNPVFKGRISTGAGAPSAVIAASNLVYVINGGSNSLQIYDVSNPTSPALRGSVTTDNGPSALALSGNYAYVTHIGNNGTLVVFDVSNPAAPARKGSVPTYSFYSGQLAVTGQYACVIDQVYGVFQVFDVSDPAHPALVGSLDPLPGNPLAIAASGRYVYVSAYISNLGGTIWPLFVIDVFHPATPTVKVIIGDGFTTPGVGKIAIAGNYAYALRRSSDNFPFLESLNLYQDVNVDGNLYVNGGVSCVSLVQTSDARYKRNIATFDNALDTILNLRGVTFDWNRDAWKDRNFPEGRQVGFIAQEVEKILPELVRTDTNGYKSVAYANVVPVLVEAMKQQQAQIEALKAENKRVTTLEAQLAALAARLSQMETEKAVRK